MLQQSKGCRNPEALVAFLNVGQGDATYIQDTTGKSILIDTGPKDSQVVTRIQEVTGCNKVSIDSLVLTHPDSDHIGEAEKMITKGLVKQVVHNGFMDMDQPDESPTENRLETTTIPRRTVLAGDILSLENIQLQVIYPMEEPYLTKPKKGEVDDNIYSLSMKITSGEHSFIVTGDAYVLEEKKMIARYKEMLDVDVLKLGHHGSKTSTSQEFLTVTSPDEVVISAGKDNSYKHPSEVVLSRVYTQQRKKPLQIRETFTEGNVVYLLE
ncbi:MAG: MBL fold metallo-hydrolase [Patescibacteria group bacterium]